MKCVTVSLFSVSCAMCFVGTASAQTFSYQPPGDLVPGSGQGNTDDTVFAPGIRFPIENAPAYANSQVWGHGGSQGPGGGQCDVENFSYPWWDNYCETRSWDMPLCPAGVGHQGQDIRAGTCDADTHWAVANTDGVITNVGSYSVYLTAADGTRFDYLHMSNVQVAVGQEVKLGDRMGMVSNQFGGTPTTVHLHFNIRQNVQNVGTVYVPTYMSLITSYSAMLDAPPVGYLDEASCDALRGWAFDADTPADPATVNLTFDGSHTESVTADYYRDDLCENLSYCEHGFWRPAPLSLFDGQSHEVNAQVDYAMGAVELTGSPASFECAPIEPTGALRPVSDATFEAWSFSSFWDEASTDASGLPHGTAWPDAPELVSDGTEIWVIDGSVRRRVESEESAIAWHFGEPGGGDAGALPEGDPLPLRPVLLRDGGALYLLDGEIDPGGPPSGPPEGGLPGDDPSAGCGCRLAGRPANTAWLSAFALALALLLRRRRTLV